MSTTRTTKTAKSSKLSKKASYKDIKKVIADILITKSNEVTTEQFEQFEACCKELRFDESQILRYMARWYDTAKTARILDVGEAYVKRVYRQAIRKMRAPIAYYRVKNGVDHIEEHNGTTKITECSSLCTKTKNVLTKKNGLIYMEEVKQFMLENAERGAYFRGLGKIGMAEVMHYILVKGI